MCAVILFIVHKLDVPLESIVAHENNSHKIDNLRYKRARHNEGIVCERQIRPLIRGMKTWT